MSKKPPQIGQKAWAPKAGSPQPQQQQQQSSGTPPASSPTHASPSPIAAASTATPGAASSPSSFVPSLPAVAQLQPGAQLRLTTSAAPSSPFDGELVVYDAAAGLLLVERFYDFADERNEHNRNNNQHAEDAGKKDYALLNVQHVRVEVTAPAPAAGGAKARALPPLHKPSLDAKFSAALHARAEERACIGVGVSPEGQKLFDSIRKTTPCVWGKGDNSKSFVVLDCIRVSPPYTVASCSIEPASQQPTSPQQQGRKSGQQQQAENMLTRVKKLVSALQPNGGNQTPIAAPSSAAAPH